MVANSPKPDSIGVYNFLERFDLILILHAFLAGQVVPKGQKMGLFSTGTVFEVADALFEVADTSRD